MSETGLLTNVDLTTCDREPIHQLGYIQPFGALVAVNGDGMVSRRSANLQEFLGLEAPLETGAKLREVFSPEAIEMIRSVVEDLRHEDEVERLFGIDLLGDERLFDCAIHRSGQDLVIEIERHDGLLHADSIASIRPMMRRLNTITEVGPMCEYAAEQLHALLGFDRVMVYRFHPDGSGEVIAEAREREIDGFLGLRYPRTDIPAQARELYVRNRFRIIADIADKPVPIEPELSINGKPLDLSLSTLRAVSPIHIEYLKNMGVRASLSISIIVRGKLWGLFACHHYAPKNLVFSQRTTAELFSQLFSLVLDRALNQERSDRRDVGRKLHDRLMTRLAGGASLIDNLSNVANIIGDAIPHDGASVFVDERYVSRGKTPTEAEFRKLLPALNSGETGAIFATDQMGDRIEAARAFEQRAVGALVIPVSRRPRDYFILWRAPLAQTVNWAGNPEKPVELGPNGARLTPRKSFETWQETVTGKSAPWTEDECEVAEMLRVTLLEVILRLTDEAVQERKRHAEQQELLIAELNHRVRNILNLIRGLVNQTRHEAGDAASYAEIIGGRIGALAAAHDNVTKQNWSPASVKALIENEADAYSGGKTDRIIIEGADCLVSPEAYTVLALVLHEMMTNSAKYGSLSDSTGRLMVGLERAASGDLTITWRERGGPPVQAPKRRGFGSTIIERSLPYELDGEAEVNFDLTGLRARFLIPARYVSGSQDMQSEDAMDEVKTTRAEVDASVNAIPTHVLLVEDNMIIALDTEDILRGLGVKKVTTASSVARAIKALQEDAPDFAVLDYNLGQESSDPVAQELSDRKIPFALATGYGDMNDKFADLGAMGILQKPYGKEEVASLFASDDQSG
ncbi:GAF domain-containing protein [Erythrobacter sp. LQ02-29]|uniref:HWE histidine kinase domain-containing protein n=1 Tax=Erythrobacter sp. LQ02-29 TaxID=2920384 RepID=UPI001F4E2C2A|nr:HWE histidine kinase domain-containing protein [Erythrobacter sp. LQ02-29]MCP9222196.1 GAF domain-containing protein [Erythrobacter sp. LQ02-29]